MGTGKRRIRLGEKACLLVAAIVVAIPDLTMASDTPMGNLLCTVGLWFTGNTGKGLATIALLNVGIFKLLAVDSRKR